MESITLLRFLDLLPLGPTEGETSNSIHRHMSDWPAFPYDCEVPLHQRWDCLKAIVSSKTTKLVTYNATVSLLPLYSYLMLDSTKRDGRSFNEFMAYLSGESVYNGDGGIKPLSADECLHSIWDLRLVAWVSFCGHGFLTIFLRALLSHAYLDASTSCFRIRYV
jgi:hypothetical protein